MKNYKILIAFEGPLYHAGMCEPVTYTLHIKQYFFFGFFYNMITEEVVIGDYINSLIHKSHWEKNIKERRKIKS